MTIEWFRTFIFSKGQHVHLDEIYHIRGFVDGYFQTHNEHNHIDWDPETTDTFICKKDFKLTIKIQNLKHT